MTNGDGFRNGRGFGHVGSASLINATDRDVTIHLSYRWTAADQSRGEIDQKVVISIGTPLEMKLSDQVSITASFRTNSDPPRLHEAK